MNLRTGTFALGVAALRLRATVSFDGVVRRGVRFGHELDAEGLLGVVSRNCRVFTWQK